MIRRLAPASWGRIEEEVFLREFAGFVRGSGGGAFEAPLADSNRFFAASSTENVNFLATIRSV